MVFSFDNSAVNLDVIPFGADLVKIWGVEAELFLMIDDAGLLRATVRIFIIFCSEMIVPWMSDLLGAFSIIEDLFTMVATARVLSLDHGHHSLSGLELLRFCNRNEA